MIYGPHGRIRTEIDTTVDRTHWTFGNLIEIQERASGTQIERRIPGPTGTIATLRHRNNADTLVYSHGDGRANRAFTDDTGDVVQAASYTTYGSATNPITTADPMLTTDDLWNGGDDIPELGVVLLGPRAYDPTLGRFLQRDPISITSRATTANPYAFGFSDPVNYADPSGLSPHYMAIVKGLSTGAASGGGSAGATFLANVGMTLANNLGRPGSRSSHGAGTDDLQNLGKFLEHGVEEFTLGVYRSALRYKGCDWVCRQSSRAKAVTAAVGGQSTRIISAVRFGGAVMMVQGGVALQLAPGAQGLGAAMIGIGTWRKIPSQEHGQPRQSGDKIRASHDWPLRRYRRYDKGGSPCRR